MKKEELIEKIELLGKDVFDIHDVKNLFPNDKHINTTIKRLIDAAVLTQITRGVYMLQTHSFDPEKLATKIYYPSYISFESALSKYGIINQGLYGLILATTRHSKKIKLEEIECSYSKIKPELFFGFNLVGGTYIAEPEKALLDTLYLVSQGKKTKSFHKWFTGELDKNKLKKYLPLFGPGVAKLVHEVIDI